MDPIRPLTDLDAANFQVGETVYDETGEAASFWFFQEGYWRTVVKLGDNLQEAADTLRPSLNVDVAHLDVARRVADKFNAIVRKSNGEDALYIEVKSALALAACTTERLKVPRHACSIGRRPSRWEDLRPRVSSEATGVLDTAKN